MVTDDDIWSVLEEYDTEEKKGMMIGGTYPGTPRTRIEDKLAVEIEFNIVVVTELVNGQGNVIDT